MDAQLHELEIQIDQMHEELHAKSPNVFQTPDSASTGPIFGRRRSVNTVLDLKFRLAKMTLEDLILQYANCSGAIPTARISTMQHLQTTTPRSKWNAQNKQFCL